MDVSHFVRDSNDSDMAALQRIYAHYVSHALATFEETPPSLDELLSRRQLIIDAGLPYLVAAVDGQVASVVRLK
jgi:L-amino acid N-acyltransferase YncA